MLMSIEIRVTFLRPSDRIGVPNSKISITSSPTYLDYESSFEFEINTNLQWPIRGPLFDHFEYLGSSASDHQTYLVSTSKINRPLVETRYFKKQLQYFHLFTIHSAKGYSIMFLVLKPYPIITLHL